MWSKVKPNLQTRNELTCKIIGPLAKHNLTDEEVTGLRQNTQERIVEQKVYYRERCPHENAQ